MGQLDLPIEHPDRGAEMLRILRDIVVRNGHKVVAELLSLSAAALSNALANARRRRVIPVQKLHLLVTLEGGEQIVEHLASLRGCAVVEVAPPTIEEEHRALTQILAESLDRDMYRCLRAKQVRRLQEFRRSPILGDGDA